MNIYGVVSGPGGERGGRIGCWEGTEKNEVVEGGAEGVRREEEEEITKGKRKNT